jgi:hypothetical protein
MKTGNIRGQDHHPAGAAQIGKNAPQGFTEEGVQLVIGKFQLRAAPGQVGPAIQYAAPADPPPS